MGNKSDKWIIVTGALIIALGGIHLLATPVVLQMFPELTTDKKLTFLFMYLAAGFGTILPGFLIVFLKTEIENNNKKVIGVLKILSYYLLLFGISAVATMWDNPFAYMTLIISGLYAVLIFKKGNSVR